jgi:hypothetical protein
MDQGQAKKLLAMLARFGDRYAETKCYESVREKLGQLKLKVQGRAEGVISLFDGKTLDGWKVVEHFPAPQQDGSGKGGEIRADAEQIIIGPGDPHSGIVFTKQFPRMNYEVELEATRLSGNSAFCVLMFAFGTSDCLLEVGGWEPELVGLDGVDGNDPRHNGTGRRMAFEQGRWYAVRLRVIATRIQVLVDGQQVVDLPTAGRRFSAPAIWRPLGPFGFGAAHRTSGALRNIRLRRVEGPAEAPPEGVKPGKWQSLFDGKTLLGWRNVARFPVKPENGTGKGGKVRVESGQMLLEFGEPMTGVECTREFPATDYEILLEAKRVEGGFDFCNLVFPVESARCALVMGRGGATVGLDAVDGLRAEGNHTARNMAFQQGRWYRIRLRVAKAKIEAWIDDEKVVDLETAGRVFSLPVEYGQFKSLGVCAWATIAAIRNVTARRLGALDAQPPKKTGEAAEDTKH